MIATKLNVTYLKKGFGVFLGLIAIWEIYSITKKYRYEKKRHNNNIKKKV